MAAPKAPLLGGAKKEVSLDEAVFAAEIKPHLVHEAVRAELNARRQGTRAAKSRGLVAGGRSKPWRQKGTGRARQGTIRAPQFAGGGVAFPPTPRDFSLKVNKKAARAALRAALSDHAQAGTLGLVAGDSFEAPSTKQAVELLQGWGQADADGRRRDRGRGDADQVLPQPAAGARHGARRARGRTRGLGALARRDRSCAAARAGEGRIMSLHPGEVLIRPVVSEKSYHQITENRYTFRVHKDAHKTQVRQAVEELFEVKVVGVNIIKMPPKPKRRGDDQGRAPRLEEGHRRAQARRQDRDLRRSAAVMPIRRYKPTSPGRRFMSVSTFEEITKSEPEKSLLAPLSKKGGRNVNGRITTRHQGGGHKRRYRIIDFKRRKDGVPAKVASIEYDPNRSARIALLHYADGAKAYILAPAQLRVGATVESGPAADIRVGNALPLENIPTGTLVHAVELKPGQGAKMARSAGSGIQLVAKDGAFAVLRLPSGEMRRVPLTCRATIGQVGNLDHQNITGGKAGRSRWRGKRPSVRGSAMNPVDHPHGGGEGKSKGGRHPVTPWGVPTLGKRTRRKHKESNKLIVRGRRRGKEGRR